LKIMGLDILKVKVSDPKYTPIRQYPADAGLDLKITSDVLVPRGGTATVSTGVSVAIPTGFVGLLVIRSGVAKVDGVSLVNGVGVIDSGYTGEIHLSLVNHGDWEYHAKQETRLAQLLILPVELPKVAIVESLEETDRGPNGMGSTGK
jgi:dUTP pyrophosphatase